MKRNICLILCLIFLITVISVSIVFAQKLDSEGKLQGKWDFLFKCGKCHSIQRPLEKRKTQEQWRETVKTMHNKGHGWITKEQVEDIIYFLSSKSLFEEKCTGCHSDFRALDLIKTKKEWTETVKSMQKKVENLISDKEADQIILYLYTIQGGE